MKTKRMIAETFLAMTKQNNIDKITVKSLIEACDISRQTFYYHFQDILEVIEWCVEQSVQEMIERSMKKETLYDAIHEFVTMVFEEQTLLDKLLRSQKWEQTEGIIFQGLRMYLQELMHCKVPQLHLKFSHPDVAMEFYTYGIAGLVIEYAGKKQTDIDWLSEQICELVIGEDWKEK